MHKTPAPPLRRAAAGFATCARGLCCLLTLLAFGPAAARAAVPKEYQIKAAFLYNFTKFVDWPADCFATPHDPIVIGVLGANPFGQELTAVVHDRRVNGRGIRVLALDAPPEAAQVHVLFVAPGAETQLAAFFAATPPPTLTVGESDRFATLGGVIRFTTVGDKVRFEINVGAAERAGLKISAQLQKLATAVHR